MSTRLKFPSTKLGLLPRGRLVPLFFKHRSKNLMAVTNVAAEHPYYSLQKLCWVCG